MKVSIILRLLPSITRVTSEREERREGGGGWWEGGREEDLYYADTGLSCCWKLKVFGSACEWREGKQFV